MNTSGKVVSNNGKRLAPRKVSVARAVVALLLIAATVVTVHVNLEVARREHLPIGGPVVDTDVHSHTYPQDMDSFMSESETSNNKVIENSTGEVPDEVVKGEVSIITLEVPSVVTVVEKNYEWYLENECGSGSDLDILARILYAEANTESEECIRKIANVVFNRTMHKSFPDTISEVVFEVNNWGNGPVYQFSPVANGTINNKSSEKCYKIAQEMLDLFVSGGYYCEDNLIAFEACGPNYKPHSSWCDYVYTIDRTAFYSAR